VIYPAGLAGAVAKLRRALVIYACRGHISSAIGALACDSSGTGRSDAISALCEERCSDGRMMRWRGQGSPLKWCPAGKRAGVDVKARRVLLCSPPVSAVKKRTPQRREIPPCTHEPSSAPG